MSQRLNITVSDDLHEELQEVKDYLNVSSICQQALQLAVRVQKTKMQAKATKETTIARVRLQRKQMQDEWFQEGKNFGLEIGSDLDYDDFVFMQELADKDVENEDEIREAIVLNPNWMWMVDQLQRQYECPTQALNTFYDGIVEGINEYWGLIEREALK